MDRLRSGFVARDVLDQGDFSLLLESVHQNFLQRSDIASAYAYAKVLSLTHPDDADMFMQTQFNLRKADPNAHNVYSQYLLFRGLPEAALEVVKQSFNLPAKMPDMIRQLIHLSMMCPDLLPDRFLSDLKSIVRRSYSAYPVGMRHVPKRPRYIIGFVSAAFYCHPMAFFIESMLRGLDRKKFLVVAFSSVRRQDDYTAALQQHVDVWYDVANMDDAGLIELIRSERVDVLIDLDNHTENNRLQVFSARCAPVQMSLYALNSPTGVQNIDYRITDVSVDPSGSDEFYSEKLIRAADCHVGFTAFMRPKVPGMSPVVKNGFWSFGSFNSSAKLNREVFGIWVEILEGFPQSCLKVFGIDDPIDVARIWSWVERAGVASSRVKIYPRVAIPDLIDAIQSVDVAFDCWPYGGGVTSATTLYAGVPILTIEGQRAISRVTSSMLRLIGLEGWIATTPRDLVRLALDLLPRANLTALRPQIQDRFLKQFVESDRHVRDIEAGLLWAIERAKLGQPPMAFTAVPTQRNLPNSGP